MRRPLPEGLKDALSLKWPRDKERAGEVQDLLGARKKIAPYTETPSFVAGVDSAFFDDRIISVACLYSYPELVPVEDSHAVRRVDFPYIPGLLSFREGPAAVEAIEGLSTEPDAVIFDGQGIAHPRGLGIASFVGAILDIPSIGCAKSRLVGEYAEPGKKKWSRSALRYRGRIVGAVLRTKDATRPVFVSPGHRIDLAGAIRIIKGCVRGYRLPEPVRRADILSRKLKKEAAAACLNPRERL